MPMRLQPLTGVLTGVGRMGWNAGDDLITLKLQALHNQPDSENSGLTKNMSSVATSAVLTTTTNISAEEAAGETALWTAEGSAKRQTRTHAPESAMRLRSAGARLGSRLASRSAVRRCFRGRHDRQHSRTWEQPSQPPAASIATNIAEADCSLSPLFGCSLSTVFVGHGMVSNCSEFFRAPTSTRRDHYSGVFLNQDSQSRR